MFNRAFKQCLEQSAITEMSFWTVGVFHGFGALKSFTERNVNNLRTNQKAMLELNLIGRVANGPTWGMKK